MIVDNPQLFNYILDNDGNVWRYVVLEIGSWNMDTTAQRAVAHGIGSPQYQTIVVGKVIIFHDMGGSIYPLEYFSDAVDPNLIGGGIGLITSLNINLYRRTGGPFDGASFDNAAINRGLVPFWYRE